MARDCHSAAAGGLPGGPGGPGGPSRGVPPGAGGGRGEFDSEYASLMAELGESGGASNSPAPQGFNPAPGAERSRMDSSGSVQAVNIGPDGKKIPPWRDPNVWNNQGRDGGGMRGRGGMMGGGGRGGGFMGGYGGRGGHMGGGGYGG